MKNYIETFLESNSRKSFISNLKKYNTLDKYGKQKCVSSLYTHLLIDAETGIDNKQIREEIISLLTNMELYNEDKFLNWLTGKLNKNNKK